MALMPDDAVELSCRECRTRQWFCPDSQQYGVWCAQCDAELTPAEDWFRQHCEAAPTGQRIRRETMDWIALFVLFTFVIVPMAVIIALLVAMR